VELGCRSRVRARCAGTGRWSGSGCGVPSQGASLVPRSARCPATGTPHPGPAGRGVCCVCFDGECRSVVAGQPSRDTEVASLRGLAAVRAGAQLVQPRSASGAAPQCLGAQRPGGVGRGGCRCVVVLQPLSDTQRSRGAVRSGSAAIGAAGELSGAAGGAGRPATGAWSTPGVGRAPHPAGVRASRRAAAGGADGAIRRARRARRPPSAPSVKRHGPSRSRPGAQRATASDPVARRLAAASGDRVFWRTSVRKGMHPDGRTAR